MSKVGAAKIRVSKNRISKICSRKVSRIEFRTNKACTVEIGHSKCTRTTKIGVVEVCIIEASSVDGAFPEISEAEIRFGEFDVFESGPLKIGSAQVNTRKIYARGPTK